PAAAALMGNDRASNFMSLGNAFVYSDKFTYIYILKGFFTFPDLPLESMFEVSDSLDSGSVSAFLPFVSASGVIAYILMQKKKEALQKDPLVIILALSVIMMFVPCLNGLFTMLNAQYYARWFFAPVLIMCIMTAIAAGEDIALFKKTSVPCMIIAALFIGGAVLYIKISGEGDITKAVISGVIPIACLALLYSCLSDESLKDNQAKLNAVTGRTALSCLLFTAFTIAQGKMTVDREMQREYINVVFRSIDEVEELKASEPDFFRVEMCENYTNRNLMWGLGSSSSFISTVNSSLSDIHWALGFPRGVNTHIPFDHAAYRSLTSVKYYFDSPFYDDEGKREPFPILGNSVEAFETAGEIGVMNLYENNCYIPMGFTYDMYISPEELETVDARIYRSQALLEAVALTVEQQERFSDIMEHYDISQCDYDYDRLCEIAAQKRETACRDFYTDKKGFGAVFENPGNTDKLVFFSVPFDDGWAAFVNGEPAQIERVSYGFMALRCSPGVSEIRFDYTSKPLIYGVCISIGGLAVLAVYTAVCRRVGGK
ncbi:MAG: YfhO family protein, partial [Ruminococcus sp.]|nr:YfhO family protein [Ruminococcus sp.]